MFLYHLVSSYWQNLKLTNLLAWITTLHIQAQCSMYLLCSNVQSCVKKTEHLEDLFCSFVAFWNIISYIHNTKITVCTLPACYTQKLWRIEHGLLQKTGLSFSDSWLKLCCLKLIDCKPKLPAGSSASTAVSCLTAAPWLIHQWLYWRMRVHCTMMCLQLSIFHIK